MLHVIYIAVAGALGALSRWGISKLALRFMGGYLPWGTLIANVAGCFLAGLIMQISLTSERIPADLRGALIIGYLGALTTFSTFSYETYRYIQTNAYHLAVLNVACNLVIGLLAAAGIYLGKTLIQN